MCDLICISCCRKALDLSIFTSMQFTQFKATFNKHFLFFAFISFIVCFHLDQTVQDVTPLFWIEC